MTKEEVWAIVRKEITCTLNALSLAADELDSYDTPELDSRAYRAGREVFQRAVANLNVCWTEGHSSTDGWGQPVPVCTRCGESTDPFEEEKSG